MSLSTCLHLFMSLYLNLNNFFSYYPMHFLVNFMPGYFTSCAAFMIAVMLVCVNSGIFSTVDKSTGSDGQSWNQGSATSLLCDLGQVNLSKRQFSVLISSAKHS